MGSHEGHPALLLVHGAWHGSWCWEYVIPLLEERGVRTTAVDLPFSGFESDVDEVRRAIERSKKPLVVCAHSYGGRVTSAAVMDSDKVVHLVYLAASMPTKQQLGQYEQSIDADPPPAQWYDEASVREVFYNDCTEQEAAKAFRRLRPMTQVGDLSGLSCRPWEHVPSTYIVCTRDNVLNPLFQLEMARNASDVVCLDTGHSPFLSNPDLLASSLFTVVSRY